MGRESDFVFHTQAGPEIGVASTKAFTCQLVTLACIAIDAGVKRGIVADRPDLLAMLDLANIRYVRSWGRDARGWQPVSFDVQPFFYEPGHERLGCLIHRLALFNRLRITLPSLSYHWNQ